MATTNLGRVQGAGFFYSSATSSTSVALSTITPSNITPLVGDSVEFSNGDVRVVQSADNTTVSLGAVVANLTGPQGKQGIQGIPGENGTDGAPGKQGASLFTSSAASSTSVALSSLSPSTLTPIVGDSVLFSNGDIRLVQGVSGTTATLGEPYNTFMTPSNTSNPNLLINSNFAINQRGETSYNSAGYCVDRWRIYPELLISVVDDGIQMSYSGTSFSQILQPIDRPMNELSGKVVTASCSVNGTIYTLTATLSTSMGNVNKVIPSLGDFTIRYSSSMGTYYVGFYETYATNPTHKVNTINWVKLEYGDTATEYIPPDPATELARCLRYGVWASLSNLPFSGNGTNNVQIAVPVPVGLRTNPTATSVTVPTYVGQGRSGIAFETFPIGNLLNNNMVSVSLTIQKPSGIPSVIFNEEELYLTVGGSCFFDAEIY